MTNPNEPEFPSISDSVKKIVDDGFKKAAEDFGTHRNIMRYGRDMSKTYQDGESELIRRLAFGKSSELNKEK